MQDASNKDARWPKFMEGKISLETAKLASTNPAEIELMLTIE